MYLKIQEKSLIEICLRPILGICKLIQAFTVKICISSTLPLLYMSLLSYEIKFANWKGTSRKIK